jgi:hypothetical protein
MLRVYRGARTCRIYTRSPAEAKLMVRIIFAALARRGRFGSG